MTRLGKGELLYGDVLSVDDLLARIDAVTPDDVRAVAAAVAGAPMSLAVVGPFADHDFSAAVRV
jgi:predicted Zn-dependent peptidase